MKAVLECRGLTSTRDGFRLFDIGMKIKQGEVVILGGRNGAGKTTLLETLVCVNRPDQGELSLLGEKVFDGSLRYGALSDLKHRLGIQFQNDQLFGSLTVRETFDSFSKFYPGSDLPDVLDDCPYIQDELDKRIEALSQGKEQLTKFLLSIAHSPDLVFLDEPVSNLDGETRRWVREKIDEMSGEGTAFFISSNEMWEIGDIADCLVVIDKGWIHDFVEPYHKYQSGCLVQTEKLKDGRARDIPGFLKLVQKKDESYVFTEMEQAEFMLKARNMDMPIKGVKRVELSDFYPEEGEDG